jgi:hypothetical protein
LVKLCGECSVAPAPATTVGTPAACWKRAMEHPAETALGRVTVIAPALVKRMVLPQSATASVRAVVASVTTVPMVLPKVCGPVHVIAEVVGRSAAVMTRMEGTPELPLGVARKEFAAVDGKEGRVVKVSVPPKVRFPFNNPKVVPEVPVLEVAAVPKVAPLVLVQVIAPVDATMVQSPVIVNPPKAPALLYWSCPVVPPGLLLPAAAEITPPEMVTVVPSGLTAPKAPVVANGRSPAAIALILGTPEDPLGLARKRFVATLGKLGKTLKVSEPLKVKLPFRNPKVAPLVPVFALAAVPRVVPEVFVHVITPVFARVQSPLIPTDVAMFEPFPTRMLVEVRGRDGNMLKVSVPPKVRFPLSSPRFAPDVPVF